MKANEFMKGLEVLKKYYDENNQFRFGCEHDQFYAYETNRPLSDEDYKTMIQLGWFQESPLYNPNDGWSCFM